MTVRAWYFRTIYFGLPILILAVSVLGMNSGTILKRPMGNDDRVEASIQSVMDLAAAGRWSEASTAMEQAHSSWRKVKGRIHFTSATDEIELFDLELAGLQGAVEGGDTNQVRIAVRRLMALWEDLGS